ncbi:MAG: DUF5689 domain-containing protein [Prevotellaceae bacterium]|nr:DUF5689 domain-containing protein [Prevotellaceae bacterium]
MKTFIRNQINSLAAIIAAFLCVTSCVDNKFDFPIEDLYNHGLVANISIADLKAMYQNSTVEITTDLIVDGYVCSSDREGNIFKTLYIQDETGGLPIVIDQSNINNSYRVGRKVLIKLKGLYLGSYSGLIQLGMEPEAGEASPSRIPSTVVSDYIVKDYEVAEIEPETVTISEIANRDELIGKLIRINDVQFATPDATYATSDANTNRTIENRDGQTIILRNSSYATFALLPLPAGSGSLTAVLSLYSTGSAKTYQLLIRDTADVAFYSPRFGGGSGSGGDGEVILRETFGNAASGSPWPSVADYTGYLKEGKGAAGVTYTAESGAVSVRNNSNSSGYSGASGECNSMMAAAGATLLVNDIATCGARNLVLSFGSNETNSTLAVSYKINGTASWVPVTYTKTDAAWGLASATVTLPAGANTIKLRFTAAATQYGTRIDDVKITTEDQTSNPIIDPDDGSGGGGTGSGDGSQANPYNVAAGQANQGLAGAVWTQGYIVGCVKNGVSTVASAGDVIIGAASGWDSQTNVLIADDPNETDYTKCIVVNLPSQKPLRTEVNLVTHPENYKKTLAVKGVLRAYFGISGLRDSEGETADFVLSGSGGGGTGGNDIFNETLLTQASFDRFSSYSAAGAEAWTFDAQYGAVMSGYTNNASHANVDWFISPAIDMSSYSAAQLKFDHARGPDASITVGIAQGWYRVYVSNNYTSGNPTSATWTELTGVTHGTGAWAYVSSGDLNIPAANLAANFRIAFRYECSDAESATWELRNVVVKE